MHKNDSEPSIFCVTVKRECTATLTNYNSTKGKCFECWFHIRTKYSIANPEMLKAGGKVMIFRPLASSPYDFKLDQHGVVGQLTKEWRMVTTHTFYCTCLYHAFTGLPYLSCDCFHTSTSWAIPVILFRSYSFFSDNLETSAINITWSSVRYRTILTINLRTARQILLFFKSWTWRQFVYYKHFFPNDRFIRRPF